MTMPLPKEEDEQLNRDDDTIADAAIELDF